MAILEGWPSVWPLEAPRRSLRTVLGTFPTASSEKEDNDKQWNACGSFCSQAFARRTVIVNLEVLAIGVIYLLPSRLACLTPGPHFVVWPTLRKDNVATGWNSIRHLRHSRSRPMHARAVVSEVRRTEFHVTLRAAAKLRTGSTFRLPSAVDPTRKHQSHEEGPSAPPRFWGCDQLEVGFGVLVINGSDSCSHIEPTRWKPFYAYVVSGTLVTNSVATWATIQVAEAFIPHTYIHPTLISGSFVSPTVTRQYARSPRALLNPASHGSLLKTSVKGNLGGVSG